MKDIDGKKLLSKIAQLYYLEREIEERFHLKECLFVPGYESSYLAE